MKRRSASHQQHAARNAATEIIYRRAELRGGGAAVRRPRKCTFMTAVRAVVVGGTRGIGAAVALALAQRGWNVHGWLGCCISPAKLCSISSFQINALN